MELYGCHNKPIDEFILVCFFEHCVEGVIPHYITIEHTMTKECQWSKTHTSERCDGCSKRARSI
jgi:hypothetical protein